MKNKLKIALTCCIIMLMIGISMLLYPSFSNQKNIIREVSALDRYVENVKQLSITEYDQVFQNALDYNIIPTQNGRFLTALSDDEEKLYENALNVDGVIGYLDIPAIEVNLPIYHGTDESVLQKGAGHLEGSSLPTDEDSIHCVLMGHNGLPSAKLFLRLDELKEGDMFTLTVLDQILTYEVDQICKVLPEEVNDRISIVEEQNYCTLITCTPYGINSHRLLVRGHLVSA